MVERVHTLVVGGGQAGIAASEHLRGHGIYHLVLERGRIAERWHSARWDSLVANGPAWHDRFPGAEFATQGDGFPGKEEIAAYFADYARRIDAPMRCGVEVRALRRNEGRAGFRAETSDGAVEAASVIVATGPFQRPVVPPLVPDDAPVMQLHSNGYRNPEQLPEGGVLVVGAGSSGTQIADELMRAGRRVVLSVGPHERPPRRYRGRDFCWWLGVLGKWDIPAPDPATAHVTIAVSGARGGETVDFRRLAARGMTLAGMVEGYVDGTIHFAPDLADNLARGDASLHGLLDEADAWAARNGVALPPDPKARRCEPDPACVTDPLRALDLAGEGIGTVLWATGYARDDDWIEVPEAFDAEDAPLHRRGVSPVPGLHFLGLPWQSRRGSSFIWGVWHDAKHVADSIAIQRGYMAHDAAAREMTDA